MCNTVSVVAHVQFCVLIPRESLILLKLQGVEPQISQQNIEFIPHP